MANVRIIPCLDVDNGRVVKGVNFIDLKRMQEIRLSKRNCIMRVELTKFVFWI